jgi:hypothetical protein
MRKFAPQLSFFPLLTVAVITLACGSSGPRTLQSISITPATAEGEAQFTATGYYNHQPSPVSPITASWEACLQGEPTSGVSVSSNGLAQCSTGASGTYTIFGFETVSGGATCNVVAACGPSPCGTVSSTAKLSCP